MVSVMGDRVMAHGPKLPGPVQQALGIPWVYDRAAAGASYGVASEIAKKKGLPMIRRPDVAVNIRQVLASTDGIETIENAPHAR